MALPMATGIMLRLMYCPTETGAPFFIPKGTCRGTSNVDLVICSLYMAYQTGKGFRALRKVPHSKTGLLMEARVHAKSYTEVSKRTRIPKQRWTFLLDTLWTSQLFGLISASK